MPWEWLILLTVVIAAAVYIVMPHASSGDVPDDAADALRDERTALLERLRELDEDTAAGRISPDDRLLRRRALGPRLRVVTEALATLGEARGSTITEPDGHGDMRLDAERAETEAASQETRA